MNLTHLKEVILSPSHLAMVLEFVTGGSVAEVRLCRGGGHCLSALARLPACLPTPPGRGAGGCGRGGGGGRGEGLVGCGGWAGQWGVPSSRSAAWVGLQACRPSPPTRVLCPLLPPPHTLPPLQYVAQQIPKVSKLDLCVPEATAHFLFKQLIAGVE